MFSSRTFLLYWFLPVLLFAMWCSPQSGYGQSAPNAPVISKIGGKQVVVGETLYTNGGQQGQASISLLIEGFSEAGATIKIYNNTTLVGTVTAQSSGTFQKSITVGEGTYSYTATATNAAGTSPASEPPVVTKVDTTPPTITALNNSTWRGDFRWVRDELQELYGTVADTGSAVLNSGIDFSSATGQIVDNTAGGTVPGAMTNNGINRIDFVPSGGYKQGSFTDGHNYTMTLTIKDKAGNTKSGTNTFTVDYSFNYNMSIDYIYDPNHQTALTKGELGTGEPTNNTPRTVTSGGKNYGSGWVQFYPYMHIYQNPTKFIVRITPNQTSPYPDGPNVSGIVELQYSYWNVLWSSNNVNGLIDTEGRLETPSFTHPKECVYIWFRLQDNAFNRRDIHSWRFYTKTGVPPAPTLTDAGIRRATFSATDPRLVTSTSGTIGASNSDMVVRRWITGPPGNVGAWKVVVPPAGTAYQNRANLYDKGDTFIDTNNNWQWDSGEPFKDFTKPATSDGASFTVLNVSNTTVDMDGIYYGYHEVRDYVTGQTSTYNPTHYIYTVDTTYPTIDDVYATPSVLKNDTIYVSMTNNPKVVVECDDQYFNPTHVTFFTFSFNSCKIEILDSSNNVVNTGHTGTFAKQNTALSYAKGELSLASVPGLAQGTYTLKVTVVDLFGNTTVDSSKTLVIDGDAPTVTAVIPAPGAMVSSLSNFQATVNDINTLGQQGSGVSFGSGDQAIGDGSYSQLRPLKVMGTAVANGQTLVLTAPLKSHTGANLAVAGQTFEVWAEGTSVKTGTVSFTSINGDQVTLTGTNLQNGTTYNVLYEIPYYHTSNGNNKLAANPINPVSQDGFYVFQVQVVDKAGNASVVTSSYEFGGGQPTLFTNATGIFSMTVTPATGLAGEPVEVKTGIIYTAGGTSVFDGTFVTVSTTFGSITESDKDFLTDGHQVKTVGGRATFHVLSSVVGSGTAHAQVGGAYSQPDGTIEFMPNYPHGTIALQSNKTSLTADGSGQVSIASTVTVKDVYNNLITGTNCPHNAFVVTAPGFTILGTDANPATPEFEIKPDASGYLHVNLQAGTVAQTSTITIASVTKSGSPLVPTASGSIGVTLQPGAPGQPFILTTTDNSLIAQTTETTVVRSNPIKDAYGNTVANGTLITVSINKGYLISAGSPVTQMTAATTGGVITVEVSAQNTTIGQGTVTAQSADQSQSGSLVIYFAADDPFGTFSLQALPSSIIADGNSTAAVTTPSPITDQYGNPVGSGVTFSCTVSAGKIRAQAGDAWQTGPVNVITTGSGMLSFQIQSSTVLENAAVFATFSATGAQGAVTVPFIAGAPHSIENLQSDKGSLIAGSTEIATISGDVTDAFGHPVADGTSVTATITYADMSQDTYPLTTTDGSFTFTIEGSDGVVGQCIIEAASGSASDSISIQFIPGAPSQNFTLSASPVSIPADGVTTSVITSSAILDAYGNTVAAGELIVVTASDGSIVTADADAETEEHEIAVALDGRITFEIQSSTVAQTVSVSAQSVNGSAMGSASIVFYAGIPAGTITLTASPDELIANSGATAQIISGVIKDIHGNTVAAGTEITVETTLGEIVSTDMNGSKEGIQVYVDAYGKIHCELSSSASSQVPLGIATVSVFSDGQPGSRAEGSVQVSMIHGTPYGDITLNAMSVPLIADNDSETLIQSSPIVDMYGNPMTEGVLVTVSASSGRIKGDAADDVSGQQAQTTSSGTISFVLEAGTQAELAEVTALSYTGTAFGKTYVQISAGFPTGTIQLTAVPDELVLDGSSTSAVTSLPIADMYGNVVEDGTLITVDTTYGTIITADADLTTPLTQVVTLDGIVSFTLSSAGAELTSATVSAQSVQGSAYGTTDIMFIAGPPSGTVALQASPSAIVADPLGLAPVNGVQTVTAIETALVITDAGGNAVSDGELFTLYSNGGEIVSYDDELPFDDDTSLSGIQIASSAGHIKFKLSSSGSPAGLYTVHAASVYGSASGSVQVAFTDTGIIDSISIILDSDRPESNRYIPWNITRAVTLVCYDEMGNRASGDTVTLSIKENNAQGELSGHTGYPGSGTTTQWSGQTDSQGVFLVDYTSPAYDAQRGDDLEDVLDASSSLVDQTQVDDRTFIVTTVVPPLFRIVSLPATGMAGEYTQFQIEIIDEFDTHITSVDPSLKVKFTSYPASHQSTGNFYRYDTPLNNFIVLGQGAANMLEWDASGYATIYYNDTKTGSADLWVEDNDGIVKSAHKAITIAPSLPTGFPLPALHASPDTIVGNGVTTSTITSDPITDGYGNPIPGATYTVAIDSGSLIAVDVDSNPANGVQVAVNASGILSFSIRSAKTTGTATVSAYIFEGGPTAEVSVAYIAGEPSGTFTLTPSATEMPADGLSSVTVTSSSIYDASGNQVPAGKLITVSSTLGSITTADADGSTPGVQIPTVAGGTISFTLQSSVQAGAANITASSVQGSANGSTMVFCQAGDAAGIIILQASPASIVANAPNSSLITSLPITDGTNVVIDGSLFTVSAERGSIVAIDQDAGLSGIQVKSTGGIISFVFNPNTGTGIVRIEADSVEGSASGFVDITLTGAGNLYGPITLHANPAVIVANGQSAAAINSTQLTDRYGNIIEEGTPVQVSTTGGTINETGLSSTTVAVQAGGILSFSVKSSTVAGQVTVTAQNESGTSAGSTQVTFEPGPPAGTIVLQATPASLVAKSGAQSIIRVPNGSPIRDSFGNIVKNGTSVTVTTTRGKLLDAGTEVNSMTVTTSGGLFSVTLRATADAATGTAQVSASSGTASGTAGVAFVPGLPSGTIALNAVPVSIVADGVTKSVITSNSITDQYGTPVADGTLVTVSTNLGVLLDINDIPITAPIAVSGGTISFKLRSSATVGTATVSAVSVTGTASGNTSVTFIPGLPAGTITLTSVPTSIIAKSGQTTAITSSVIRDANGNAVGAGIGVTITCSSGVLDNGQGTQASSITIQTDAGSKVNCTFVANASTSVGNVSVTANSVTGAAQTAQPLIIQLKSDRPAGTIMLYATPTQIVADGQSSSHITSDPITDQYGNAVNEGTLVTIIPTWGTIVEPDADPVTYQNHQIAVNAQGRLSFHLQSETKVGVSNISATSPTGTASGSIQVIGIPGPVASLVIVMPGETFDADEPDGKAGGPPADQVINVPFAVKVYPVDAFGNHVISATLAIELLPLSAYMQCSPSWAQSFNGVSGELIFTVQDTISGLNLAFQAQDTVEGSITGTGNLFDIIAGSPVKVQILLPGQTAVPGDSGDGISGSPAVQQAGVPFQVIVNYVDIYYNVVTGAQGTVELSSSGVGAILPENTVLTNGSAVLTVTETTFSNGATRVVTANIYPSGGGSPISISSDPFQVTDTLAPQLISFSINAGSQLTASQMVTLAVEALDAAGSAISMRFRNEDGVWSNYMAYQSTIADYSLSTGRGLKTVHIQLKDANGNESAVFSDSILYATPPTASAGGDYIINEGQSVTFDAGASTDADPGDILTYEWDLDGDGQFDDAIGVTVTRTYTD
ncbi:MAG: PKD domain-containing protein, partial [Candidatus Auribacterota bacterium]